MKPPVDQYYWVAILIAVLPLMSGCNQSKDSALFSECETDKFSVDQLWQDEFKKRGLGNGLSSEADQETKTEKQLSDIDVSHKIADAYRSNERYADALPLYQKLAHHDKNSYHVLELAEIYMKLNHLDESEKIYAELLKTDNFVDDAYIGLARVAEKRQRYESAETLLGKALELARKEPDFGEGDHDKIFSALADCYCKRQQYGRAETMLEAEINERDRAYPSFASDHKLSGVLLLSLAKCFEAPSLRAARAIRKGSSLY